MRRGSRGRLSIWITLLALALLLAVQAGCLVTPLEESDLVRLGLSVGLPQGTGTFSTASTPFDELDQFHLEIFPKFVRVAVETADYELTSGTWPDPFKGIGSGEGSAGEVDLTLQVPAGSDRRVRALGYLYDGGRVTFYQDLETGPIELVAGQTRDLTIEMISAPTGSVDLSVRCEYGNTDRWQPVQVALIDAQAFVLLPPVDLERDSETQALSVELSGVPVGRVFQTRVFLANVTTGAVQWADVRSPTFTVARVSDMQAVNLTIPCHAF